MRGKMIFIIMSVATVAFVACQSTTVEEPGQLKQEVEDANTVYWQTMLAGDFDSLPSFYTDDAVLMPHGNEKMGAEGMIAQQRQGKEMGITVDAYTSTALDVWGSGDMVYEVGTYEMKTSMEGMPEPKSDHGSYMCVWEKSDDGSLKRKYFIWNTSVVEMPAAAPVASFEGNWELMSVEGTYPDGKGGIVTANFTKDSGINQMKLIHDNFFMFSGQQTMDGDATPVYGYGTYTFENNVYTEHVICHVGEDAVGTSPSFEMTVDGDTLIQKGPIKIGDFKDADWEVTETYVRK